MALAKPVIASRIGGVSELIADNKNGLLFEPGNKYELALKICLLSDNPEKTQALGQAAKEKVEQEFNKEKHLTAMENIYQSLTKKQHDLVN